MATLIGDPPNILIGSAVGLSFMDFVYNVGPAAFLIQIVMLFLFDFIWGRKLETTEGSQPTAFPKPLPGKFGLPPGTNSARAKAPPLTFVITTRTCVKAEWSQRVPGTLTPRSS